MKKKRLFSSKSLGCRKLRPVGFRSLVILLVMLSSQSAIGQTESIQVIDGLTSHNSIVRTYGDGKLIYTEDIVMRSGTDLYHIQSSKNKFILINGNGDDPFVAELPLNFCTRKWRINDMKILGDTAYFCGYMDDGGRFKGFIGYFNIFKLFYENESLRLLEFNPYPNNSFYYFCINYPTRLEPVRAQNGLHLLCVGSYAERRLDTIQVDNPFIADIVHRTQSAGDTSDWWYYAHKGSMERYTDIAVTDNYAASVAVKEDSSTFYLRMYKQPHRVACNTDFIFDDSFFSDFGQAYPLPAYYSYWHPQHYLSRINRPLITHTVMDSVAIAFSSYAIRNGEMSFGTEVKHFSLSNMFLQIEEHVPNDAVVVPGWNELILSAVTSPDYHDWDETISSIIPHPDLDTMSGSVYGERLPNYAVPIYYNQRVLHSILDAMEDSWPVKEISYCMPAKKLFFLQQEEFPPQAAHNNFDIFAFDFQNALQPVEHIKPDDSQYLQSIDSKMGEASINLSGFINDDFSFSGDLLFGRMADERYGCMSGTTEVESFDPGGMLVGRAFVGEPVEFNYFRMNPGCLVQPGFKAFSQYSINLDISRLPSVSKCEEN